jgi:hypothetical protein
MRGLVQPHSGEAQLHPLCFPQKVKDYKIKDQKQNLSQPTDQNLFRRHKNKQKGKINMQIFPFPLKIE